MYCQINLTEKLECLNEELDENKFVTEFTEATVKGWKGLKLKIFRRFNSCRFKRTRPRKLKWITLKENAQTLVENSSEFDNWLNEVVFDLENFRSSEQRINTPKAKPVSGQ